MFIDCILGIPPHRFNVFNLTVLFVQLHSYADLRLFTPIMGGIFTFPGHRRQPAGRPCVPFRPLKNSCFYSPINKTPFRNSSKNLCSEFLPFIFEYLVICGNTSEDSSELRMWNFAQGKNFGSTEHFKIYLHPDCGKFAIDQLFSHIRKAIPQSKNSLKSVKHFGKKKQHFKLPEDFSSEENLKSRNCGNFEVVPKCSHQRLPITIWNNDTSYKRYNYLNILPLNSVTRCISKMNSKIKSINKK